MMPSSTAVLSRRARPLPRDARRAALVSATLPLIRKHGVDVSTRQIAAAAGVAEGTIFRVFPDKDSLIQASVDAAFDPAPVVAALDRIDPSTPLPARLIAVVRIVQAWLTTVINLMMVLRGTGPLGHKPQLRRPRPSEVIGASITRLIEPDRDQLRMPPAQAERLLRLMLFAGSHPGIADGKLLTAEEIVHVILDGVRVHGAAAPRGRNPC